jgi:hypothetical protein
LSIESVLRAIQIEAGAGWLVVVGQSTDPIVWSQASTAINPNATVSLNPSAINFGEVPVQTPEPGEWILLLTGLAAFGLGVAASPPNAVCSRKGTC